MVKIVLLLMLRFLLEFDGVSIPDEPPDTQPAFLGHQNLITSLIVMPG